MQSSFPGSAVSYVLLAEDDGFEFPTSTKQLIAEKISEHTGSTKSKASLFLADTRLQPEACTVSAHRKVTVMSDTKLITLTLLGDTMSDQAKQDLADDGERRRGSALRFDSQTHTPRRTPLGEKSSNAGTGSPSAHPGSPALAQDDEIISPKLRKPSGGDAVGTEHSAGKRTASGGSRGGSRKSSAKDSPIPIHPDEVSAGSDKEQQSKPGEGTKSDVTKAELKRLADLWSDDRLGLYDTKWPIPTHLARLATKRAQLHMRLDKWNKTDDAAPCSLPQVHKDVENTLYFL
ncbi:hypothetical protein LTR37_004070 [Vermiconidia calcicola]|uniref:Uncharacterized protein n=1 Tax=Vermiconidia calcicola TaxID=1690605 RepID=A0ACC3NNF3_9PEZI|nr:hypothetical protein LTR37_004070 [Vermiconidia calcicola]